MIDMIQKGLFDEYIQDGTPEQKECADAWRVAIGLQAVDGLTVSDYLIELARKNIEGELTIDEVIERIRSYYDEKRKRKAAWKEYETYTRIDQVTDPVEARRGRPI